MLFQKPREGDRVTLVAYGFNHLIVYKHTRLQTCNDIPGDQVVYLENEALLITAAISSINERAATAIGKVS